MNIFKMNRIKLKSLKSSVFVALFLCVIFILFLSNKFYNLYVFAKTPVDSSVKVKTNINIYSGHSINAISKLLYKKGIVSDSAKFKLLMRVKRLDKKVRAGEYELSCSMTPDKIIEILVNGKAMLHKITIPEGYNINQIAASMAKAGFFLKSDFIKAATDTDCVKRAGIDGNSFEGYLFPDTYFFPMGISSDKIITIMVERFKSKFSYEWENRAKKLHLSIHDVVTLASIIEKETGVFFERPIISSVFHNRLKKNMPLESDPTVIYGIDKFDGNITRKHLAKYTPYNTYRKKGLPIGPIANPGIESIHSVLYPADTNYLYFVSKGDKTHKFSTNYKNHRKAVKKYQLLRR